jgi:DSBA-like thioredoxin domain
VLLQRVAESGGHDLRVRWRYFSLAQVNNHQEGWTIWDAAPDDPEARGRLGFQAAEASRRQGRFEAFHGALLSARHLDREDIDDLSVVEKVASRSGLDLDAFRRDVADPSALEALARDHLEAVEHLGVFGTPTFHFPGRGAAYVRVRPAPEGEAVLNVFDQIVSITADEPYFQELKRTRGPRRQAPVEPDSVRAPVEPGGVRAPAEEVPAAGSAGSPRPG